MEPRRARPPAARGAPYPRHPTGRVRRRWPRAYDGGEEPRVNGRYRWAYDGERRRERREPDEERGLSLDVLRNSPVRNGLIGLAVVGAAAPLAVNRYQQALRTDPAHERVATTAEMVGADDAALASVWNSMESETVAATSARDRTVEANVQEYSEFGLTRELAEDIYDLAVEAEVDPEIAFGLVRAESSFKNTSTSRVGAVGLTQLMPKTAAWLVPGTTVSQLREPETNLRIGFKYLRDLIDKYGDEDLALTAYNRGPGTVDRILKRGGDPDNGYAGFVKSGDVGSHEG